MKTLLSTLTIVTLLAAAPAFAEGANHQHEANSSAIASKAECEDTINVTVDGLVCDFCARALEKVFGKRDDVKDIKVDLDNGSVIVVMQPGKTIDDETLTQLITDSGYNVRNIEKDC